MRLSVVIPTRGRASILESTLRTLSAQRIPEGGFEVIVVLDGADEASLALLERQSSAFPVPLIGHLQEHAGPAAARNAGVARARGDIVLFLGDDTAPANADLVLRHADLHAGTPSSYAVLGQVVPDWAEGGPTPLAGWLERSGRQFDFGRLSPGPVPPSRYFYTAHVSLDRVFLGSTGGFEERFPFAAVEDIEFGVRLEDAGLHLDYHPELVVVHNHPTTLAESLCRAERVGRAAALYAALHPDRPHPGLRRPGLLVRRLVAIGGPAVAAVGQAPLPPPLRERVWRLLHVGAYVRGYAQGPPSL
jgi:glycosyltransferase involved in cell wall biosynthesis